MVVLWLNVKERDQAIAKLTKADIDAVIQKYIHLDGLVEGNGRPIW